MCVCVCVCLVHIHAVCGVYVCGVCSASSGRGFGVVLCCVMVCGINSQKMVMSRNTNSSASLRKNLRASSEF